MTRWPWLRRIAGTHVLATWFGLCSLVVMVSKLTSGGMGGDAVIYHRAAATWAAGGNPWDAFIVAADGVTRLHFYGLPPTVILLQPFVLLPESLVPLAGIALQGGAAVYVVRRLALPIWWLIFPPIVTAVFAGNPSIIMLALLLLSHPTLKAVAPILKVYAGLALLGEKQWMAVGIGIAATAATVFVWPGLWIQFLDGAAGREAQLMEEAGGGYSAYRYGPVLAAAVACALLILARYDLRVVGWLTPVAIWPGSQFHWNTLALPVMHPILAVGLAAPVQGLPPWVVLGFLIWRVLRHLRERRPQMSGHPTVASLD